MPKKAMVNPEPYSKMQYRKLPPSHSRGDIAAGQVLQRRAELLTSIGPSGSEGASKESDLPTGSHGQNIVSIILSSFFFGGGGGGGGGG